MRDLHVVIVSLSIIIEFLIGIINPTSSSVSMPPSYVKSPSQVPPPCCRCCLIGEHVACKRHKCLPSWTVEKSVEGSTRVVRCGEACKSCHVVLVEEAARVEEGEQVPIAQCTHQLLSHLIIVSARLALCAFYSIADGIRGPSDQRCCRCWSARRSDPDHAAQVGSRWGI